MVDMIVDGLGEKSVQILAWKIEERLLIGQFRDLNLELNFHKDFISCGRLTITNDFFGKIKRNS